MKVITLIELDDGTEIRIDARNAEFVGLQCQHCFTTYELGGSLTNAQAREVAVLYTKHVASCRTGVKHLPGHA